MDVVKDFLISTFFESALAFLWICVLVVAWRRSYDFVECPVATTNLAVRRWVNSIPTNKAAAPLAILFVLFSYPLGVVMQRVSDEFIETTSLWMPKKVETDPWLFRKGDIKDPARVWDQFVVQGVGRCDLKLPQEIMSLVAEKGIFEQDTGARKEALEALVKALNKVLAGKAIHELQDVGISEPIRTILKSEHGQHRIRVNRLLLKENYGDAITEGGGWWRVLMPVLPYEPFGRDGDIKQDVWERYKRLLTADIQRFCESSEASKKEQKVVRDTRTRRAFGREGSAAYMNRLLELVRVCQAAAMHLFLLFFVLLWLSLFLILSDIKRKLWRWGLAIVLLTLMSCWTFFLVPSFHDSSELNLPVFIVFLLVDGWLLVVAWRFWRESPSRGIWNGLRAAQGMLISAFVALALCYFATFSWSEHRENYEETVLILGEERGQQLDRVVSRPEQAPHATATALTLSREN